MDEPAPEPIAHSRPGRCLPPCILISQQQDGGRRWPFVPLEKVGGLLGGRWDPISRAGTCPGGSSATEAFFALRHCL